MSRLQGPADFRENPLAHFEKESQLSVSFDKWVSTHQDRAQEPHSDSRA